MEEDTANEDTEQVEQPKEATDNEIANEAEQSAEITADDTASEKTPPADEQSTELNVDVATVDNEVASPDHSDQADATDEDRVVAFDRKEDNVTKPELPATSDDASANTSTTIEDTKPTSSTDNADEKNSGEKKSVVAKKSKGNSSGKSANKGSAKKKPTKKKKKSNANGYAPVAWEVPSRAPTENNRDKLTDIKGVGPVLEGLLHDSGIYYFKQVALLDKDGVNELQEQIPQFPGRIKRDKWVSQAKTLHRRKYGEAAKKS